MNAGDSECRTPLLVATAKSGWKTVKYLLKQDVQIDVKDKTGRNFLHLAIMNGCNWTEFENIPLVKKVV